MDKHLFSLERRKKDSIQIFEKVVYRQHDKHLFFIFTEAMMIRFCFPRKNHATSTVAKHSNRPPPEVVKP